MGFHNVSALITHSELKQEPCQLNHLFGVKVGHKDECGGTLRIQDG